MLLSSPAGNDLMFDKELCKQGSGFVNKIWNAFRLVKGWKVDSNKKPSSTDSLTIKWYENRFQQMLVEIENNYDKYRISDALMSTYKLIWDDFCSWFLEMIKPAYSESISEETYLKVIELFEANLKILHPFVPFVTEEIWQQIAKRDVSEALIISTWPESKVYDKKLIKDFEFVMDVISGIRNIRKDKNISFKDTLTLKIINREKLSNQFDGIISKLTNLDQIDYVTEKPKGAMTFRVKSNEYFIPLVGAVNLDEEREKLLEELKYAEGFLKSVQKKLSNERFVSGAPEKVVALERQKEADTLAKIETLKASLKTLQ